MMIFYSEQLKQWYLELHLCVSLLIYFLSFV